MIVVMLDIGRLLPAFTEMMVQAEAGIVKCPSVGECSGMADVPGSNDTGVCGPPDTRRQNAEEDGMANVKVGQQAPDFTLKNQDNEDVTLSALRGRPVVLVFYPLDFSGICTTELCAIRDDYRAFQEAGAVVLGISRDSRHAHKAWKEATGIKHDLLADMKGEVARLYGAWNEELGFAERLTAVIDPSGTIVYVVHNPAGAARDHHEALDALRTLQPA